jgi:HAE1 family hydrophobic/amphiphilic exporter-1
VRLSVLAADGLFASTCLAVLFVPTFFVVIQRFENWLAERKGKTPDPQPIPQAPSVTP